MKLRGLVVVLAISGSLSGVGGCGNVADEVGEDAGSLDATGVSPGDVMVVDATLDGTLDAARDVRVADATLDVLSAPEAGDASGVDATPDSARDVAVADVALDSPSGPEAGGSEPEPPSCAPGGAGMTNCGPGGSGSESCCTSLEVTGGTFYRSYSNYGSGPAGEADPATVSSFSLDKYLVTVGRFRQYVAAWNNGRGWMPPDGSGKHGYLPGGGLANTAGGYETGWDAKDWNNTTDVDPAYLASCCYPPSTGDQENQPIAAVTWYEAYAFCIWDGGFLPSEAEWEYAAAGGSQQREYPWGTTDPGTGNQYAIYALVQPEPQFPAPVGTASMGAGAWGQLDLAGEVWEWTLDVVVGGPATGVSSSDAGVLCQLYVDCNVDPYVDPCTNCAALPVTAPYGRVLRGGGFNILLGGLRPTYNEYYDIGTFRNPEVGFRCARNPN